MGLQTLPEMCIYFLACFIGILNVSGTVNLAYKRPATQSSNATSTFTADRAVDGIKKKGADPSNPCAFTQQELTAWWQVDLGRDYEVKTVTLTTRATDEHLKNLTITLSGDTRRPEVTCLQDEEMKENPTTFNCIKSVTGRYLRISQTRPKHTPLILCEVEVQGSVPKQLYIEHTYHQLSKRIQTAYNTLRTTSFPFCALKCSQMAGCDKFQWKRSTIGDNNCKIGGVALDATNKDSWMYFEITTP